MLRLVTIALVSVAFMPRAAASCGLDACPLPTQADLPTTRLLWRVATLARVTTFSLEGASGHYVESIVRAEFVARKRLRFGALLPTAAVFVNGQDADLGLGNTTGYVDWTIPLAQSIQMRLGTQVEAPTGTHHSIASDHFELLPYVGISAEAGRFRFRSELGLRLSAGGEHDHNDMQPQSLLVVNPHEDREFVYRATTEFDAGHHLRPGLTLQGQHVLQDADQHAFLLFGGQLTWEPTRRWAVVALAELPVIQPARFDMRIGVNASAAF